MNADDDHSPSTSPALMDPSKVCLWHHYGQAAPEEILARLVRLETRDEDATRVRNKMAGQMDQLIVDLYERRGRDNERSKDRQEEWRNKSERNQWLRAILPVGILTSLWIAIAEFIRTYLWPAP